MANRQERLALYRSIRQTPPVQDQTSTIEALTLRVQILERSEAERKVNDSFLHAIGGSLRWWGGAVGLAEALKFSTWTAIPAVREVPAITALQSNLSWIVGCTLGPSIVEKIVTPITQRFNRFRASRTARQQVY